MTQNKPKSSEGKGISTIEIIVLVVIILLVGLSVFMIMSGNFDSSQPNCFNSKLGEMPAYCLLLFK